MGRAARRTLGTGFLALTILFLLAGGVAGQAGNDTNATDGNATAELPQSNYVIAFHEVTDDSGNYLWDITELHIPPAANVTFVYDSTGASTLHNIAVAQVPQVDFAGTVDLESATLMANSGRAAINFTMPDEEGTEWTYVCTIHPETMIGSLTAGPFSTGGVAGAGAGINEVGVHFLAYWVGIISFAVLFVTYGASFFLFKHGETAATTDQKDRPGFEDKTTIMGLPEYVWAIIGILVIAAAIVIFFQIMLGGF